VVRLRPPALPLGEAAPAIVLLHGWTGDETSMGVFTPALPADHWLIAPRGPYVTQPRGFSWRQYQAGTWPTLEGFRPVMDDLWRLLSATNFPQVDFARLTVMGFSQGAALTYALALAFPQRVAAFIGLAGFLPDGAETLADGLPLQGKRAYVAHGSQDEIVPIERARQAVQTLRQAGAEVDYCEHEAGHKLGTECYRGLRTFFAA